MKPLGFSKKKCEHQLRIMVRSCLWKFILLLSLLSYRVTPTHAPVLGMKTLRKMRESLFCLLSWTNKCKDTTIFQNLLVRIWWNLAKLLSISHFNHWKPETLSWRENFCDTIKFQMTVVMLKISKTDRYNSVQSLWKNEDYSL